MDTENSLIGLEENVLLRPLIDKITDLIDESIEDQFEDLDQFIMEGSWGMFKPIDQSTDSNDPYEEFKEKFRQQAKYAHVKDLLVIALTNLLIKTKPITKKLSELSFTDQEGLVTEQDIFDLLKGINESLDKSKMFASIGERFKMGSTLSEQKEAFYRDIIKLAKAKTDNDENWNWKQLTRKIYKGHHKNGVDRDIEIEYRVFQKWKKKNNIKNLDDFENKISSLRRAIKNQPAQS